MLMKAEYQLLLSETISDEQYLLSQGLSDRTVRTMWDKLVHAGKHTVKANRQLAFRHSI